MGFKKCFPSLEMHKFTDFSNLIFKLKNLLFGLAYNLIFKSNQIIHLTAVNIIIKQYVNKKI